MRQSPTKYTTSYTREFSEETLCAAAKAAFIQDLGGADGLKKRGIKAGAIVATSHMGAIRVRVTSRECAVGEPSPVTFVDCAYESEAL